MSLETTPSLRRALDGIYYKEGCDQKGWAYISLENIYNSGLKNNILVFKKGFHKINIKIPEQLIPEIKEICKPISNSKENPDFVFDYLACRVGQRTSYDDPVIPNPLGLCWTKVKTGNNTFSDNQVAALEKINLMLTVFCIQDELASPRRVEIEWDIRSGKEWLDEMDDKKDQEEYDDEFF